MLDRSNLVTFNNPMTTTKAAMSRLRTRFTISPVLGLLLLLEPICLAQSPLELLNEKVPKGERFSYGANELQFGELTLPKGSGPAQWWFSCTADAGKLAWRELILGQRLSIWFVP